MRKVNCEKPTKGFDEIARQLIQKWEPNFGMRMLMQGEDDSLDSLIAMISDELAHQFNEGLEL